MSWYEILPMLINVSLTASVAIVLVLLLRLVLKKAPKVASYALWAIVLFRLLCPVSIESGLSLYSLLDAPAGKSGDLTSSIEYVPTDIIHAENPSVALPLPGVSEAVNDILPQGREQAAADPMEAPVTLATYVWIAGVAAMAVYGAVSYIRLRRKLAAAVPLRDNVYIADGIDTPFVVGILRPKVYLPSTIGERELEYVVLREQHHIRGFDHVTRALAFAALCIHWFNPLVWAAFVLSGKDMEMSCDEAVMRKMGAEVRADYSASLLGFATGRRLVVGMPLAFGEGDTRGRIENLARWKKPGALAVVAAVAVCAVAAVALATNPAGEDGAGLFPGYYQAEEIIYKNAKYAELDFLSEEDLPQVNLSAAGLLLLSDGSEWLNVGTMEETSLQEGNFDDYFYGVTYEASPGALRRWAEEARLTISVPTAYNGIAAVSKMEGLGEHGQLIYYAFSTSDGSAYLACGSWDKEALSDPASDDSEFLWVARLAKMPEPIEQAEITEPVEQNEQSTQNAPNQVEQNEHDAQIEQPETAGTVIATPLYTATIPEGYAEGLEWKYNAEENSMSSDASWEDANAMWFGHSLSVSLNGEAPMTTFFIMASRQDEEGNYVVNQGRFRHAKVGEIKVGGETWVISVCKGMTDPNDPDDSSGEIKAAVDEYATWIKVDFDPSRVTDETIMDGFLESHVGQEWAAWQ